MHSPKTPLTSNPKIAFSILNKSARKPVGSHLRQQLEKGGFLLEQQSANGWFVFHNDGTRRSKYEFSTLAEVQQWWVRHLENMAIEKDYLAQFEALFDASSELEMQELHKWFFGVPIIRAPPAVATLLEKYMSAKRPWGRKWRAGAERTSLQHVNEPPMNFRMRLIRLFESSERRRLDNLPAALGKDIARTRL